jgi:hypothetical protein
MSQVRRTSQLVSKAQIVDLLGDGRKRVAQLVTARGLEEVARVSSTILERLDGARFTELEADRKDPDALRTHRVARHDREPGRLRTAAAIAPSYGIEFAVSHQQYCLQRLAVAVGNRSFAAGEDTGPFRR